jgi:hypothetical protein
VPLHEAVLYTLPGAIESSIAPDVFMNWLLASGFWLKKTMKTDIHLFGAGMQANKVPSYQIDREGDMNRFVLSKLLDEYSQAFEYSMSDPLEVFVIVEEFYQTRERPPLESFSSLSETLTMR